MKAEQPSDAAREAFHQLIHSNHMYGLWEIASQTTPQPRPEAVAHIWKWSPWSRRSCNSPAPAVPVGDERRAMQLFNPGLNGQVGHHQHAHRRGAGAHARRDRARAPPLAERDPLHHGRRRRLHRSRGREGRSCNKGDLVLTPNWQWHDHGNETGANHRLDGRPGRAASPRR